MLFDDGLFADFSGDGDEAGEHAVLFLAVRLELRVLQLRVYSERSLQVASQRLIERLLDPRVLIFVRVTAGAGGDIQDGGSFGEPGAFKVAGETDAVFVDGSFGAAFDAEHDGFTQQ